MLLLAVAAFPASARAVGPGDDAAKAAEVHRNALTVSESALATGDHSLLRNAVSLAKRATDLAPTVPDYWLLLGRLSARAGGDKAMATEAEGALRNGVALNPGSAGGHLALGCFYFLQDRFADALQEFETAVYISPELVTPTVIAAMCQSYSRRKEWARGENFFQSVVRQYPNADIVRLALAAVYQQEGRTDKAELEMRRVITRPGSPESNAECAWRIVNNWENEGPAR